MFVGITRAEEELQISMAAHRDFRGQRKMTVPSRFLMELPRSEMEVHDMDAAAPQWAAPARPPVTPASTAPRVASGVQLTTAAEMAGQTAAPTASPEDFHQGMLVRHPAHGLGRVIALSGSGKARKATVQFVAGAAQKKFVLASSPLKPVKNGPAK